MVTDHEPLPQRSVTRQMVAPLVIVTAVCLILGHTIRQPSLMAANDISRWCTVWSLLERGSYVIDECPWQLDTQDKILTAVEATKPDANGSAAPVKHYYSSKPALLPTLIAAVLYPVRKLTGVPIDRVVLQPRVQRSVLRRDPADASKLIPVTETPTDRVKWPAYPFISSRC